jgi:hypothetical protein
MIIDGGPEGFIKTSKTHDEYFGRECKCKKEDMAIVLDEDGANGKLEGMDKCITAKWAKETAEKVLGEKVKVELHKCEEAIRKAVKENKMSTTVYFRVHDLTKHVLVESRGFRVQSKYSTSQMDNDSTTISWDSK